jgi:hypothetical protein
MLLENSDQVHTTGHMSTVSCRKAGPRVKVIGRYLLPTCPKLLERRFQTENLSSAQPIMAFQRVLTSLTTAERAIFYRQVQIQLTYSPRPKGFLSRATFPGILSERLCCRLRSGFGPRIGRTRLLTRSASCCTPRRHNRIHPLQFASLHFILPSAP